VPFFDHRPEWSNWATVRWIFRRCQLYDFEKEVWYSYREAMQLGAS